jgi:phosphate-selective porin OprO and OprP
MMKRSMTLAAALLLPACAAVAQDKADRSLAELVRAQALALEAQSKKIGQLEQQLADLSQRVSVQEAPPAVAVAVPATPVVDRLDLLRGIPAGNAALRPPPDPLTAPSPSETAGAPDETFDWKKGLPQITSDDERYAMRLRGRVLFDSSSTSGSKFDQRNISGTEARAMRIGVEGKAGDLIAYQFEADIADNQAEVRGAYLALTPEWRGTNYEISLGNRLTDRSLEGASSSDSLPFMERSATALGSAPSKGSFGLGAMVRVYGDGWHASTQVDGNDLADRGDRSDDVTVTARAHWNPWRSQDAIVHLGAWGYREYFAGATTSAPLSTRIGSRFNDLVRIQGRTMEDPDRGSAFGLEVAGTWHSAWAIAEHAQRRLHARDEAAEVVQIQGTSVSAGYYLTGEKPPYVARGGTWSKPRVLRPVLAGGGGAVEIAARHDRLTYDGPSGAEGNATTLGVNWYLIDWVRLTLNWIHWQTDNRTGQFIGPDQGNTVTGRVQVSF